jgi:phospholipid/cholesterol/gamma-HCH transport system substrate-binding protein
MRRVVTVLLALVAVPALILLATGASNDNDGDYKVRAIFDNASFLISGQDVKVAGAKVGVVDSLDVTSDHKAAIVLKIDRDGFKDFRKDAKCEIRLQSVIGEKLIECTPTQPRDQGEPEAPPLDKVPDGQPGAGQYLLPVENTVTPVDADLINNIQRRPFRERFSILLNEFGTGLASRADDLKQAIRRGNPALKEFDDFLRILAGQNRMLKNLTADADRIFRSFAANRRGVAQFFAQSRVPAQVTAENRRDFERNLQKFPPFLRELKPFMDRFAGLSRAMEPVVSDLRVAGPDLSRVLKALGPFSTNSTAALQSLGDTADVGRPALVGAEPLANQLSDLTSRARGTIKNLRLLLTDLDAHQGIERFLDLLFYQTLSFNGFDEVGHYLRNNLIVTICSGYAITPTIGCSANFQSADTSSASSAATSRAKASTVARRLARLISGGEVSSSKDKSKGDSTNVSSGGGSDKGTSGAEAGATHEARPKAQSPSQPAPKRPSGVEQQNPGDPMLDYLLGGDQ